MSKKKIERVNQTELAKLTGFSKQWISRLKKQGKLIFGDDGKIDYAQGLAQLEASKEYGRESQRNNATKRRGGPAGMQPGLMGAESIYDADGKIIYGNVQCSDGKIGIETQRSRLVRETMEARLAEIKLARERGELVPVDAVRDANQLIASSVRSKFLGLPTKTAQQLEGLKAPEIQRVLEDAVNAILTEINTMEAGLV